MYPFIAIWRKLSYQVPIQALTINQAHWSQNHAGLFGQTGSGKSTLMAALYHYFLLHDTQLSSLLIDPHGDLAKSLIRLNTTQNVVYVCPFFDHSYQPARTPVINLLDTPNQLPRTILEYRALSLAEALEEMMGDVSNNMKLTLQVCCLTLMMMPQVDLRDLVRFVSTSTAKPYLRFAKQHLHNVALNTFLEDSFLNAKRTREAIAFRLTGLLASSAFHNLVCGKSTLDLNTLLNNRHHILLDLSGLPKSNADAMGKLMLSTVKSLYLQRALVPQRKRPRIRLWLDEGNRFMGNSFTQVLQEARKFGVLVTFASQSYLQALPVSVREAMRTNTAIKILGRVSYQSANAFSHDTQADIETLMALKHYQFYYDYSYQKKQMIFHCPKQTMEQQRHTNLSTEQWKKYKHNLLKRYYRPIEQTPNQLIKGATLVSKKPSSITTRQPNVCHTRKILFPLHP